MMETGYQHLREIGRQFGVEIHRPGMSQLHFMVHTPANLLLFCSQLRETGCYLVTVVANDERELEDDCFKIYYVFSHPSENVFLAVEYPLQPGRERYPSILALFPAVEPFEAEIADFFGLYSEEPAGQRRHGAYLHASYLSGQYPLRRDWSQSDFQKWMSGAQAPLTLPPYPEGLRKAPLGELFFPVGPVHAGVIEPGNFMFRVSGESIEEVEMQLGYTHKGIERLYQRSFELCSGWKLAERVCGDTSFAHSVAYAKAVEVMAKNVLPPEVHLLRALLLELERMVNHIGDCGALAHDLALEVPAAELSVLREKLMYLNERVAGSRFLRGVNRPGGICLPRPLVPVEIRSTIDAVAHQFLRQAHVLAGRSDFRERTVGLGLLPHDTALHLGITGFAARASGIDKDFRKQHPFGPYASSEAQLLLGCKLLDLPVTIPAEMNGDVFSRFVQRILEVYISQQLIGCFLGQWVGEKQTDFSANIIPSQIANYEWGLGYVEGWRGDIAYWVMKDKFERIYRCKVRDPSTINWPGLKAAVVARRQGGETALSDFPLINKSFNLSYTGNDL